MINSGFWSLLSYCSFVEPFPSLDGYGDPWRLFGHHLWYLFCHPVLSLSPSLSISIKSLTRWHGAAEASTSFQEPWWAITGIPAASSPFSVSFSFFSPTFFLSLFLLPGLFVFFFFFLMSIRASTDHTNSYRGLEQSLAPVLETMLWIVGWNKVKNYSLEWNWVGNLCW